MNNSNGIYVSRQMYCIFIYLKSKEVKQQKVSTLWQIYTTGIILQARTCLLPLEYTGKDAARRGGLLLTAAGWAFCTDSRHGSNIQERPCGSVWHTPSPCAGHICQKYHARPASGKTMQSGILFFSFSPSWFWWLQCNYPIQQDQLLWREAFCLFC